MTDAVVGGRFCAACGSPGVGAFCPACGVATAASAAMAPALAIATQKKAPTLMWTIIKAMTIGMAIVAIFIFIGSSGSSSGTSSGAVPVAGQLAMLARECPASPSKASFDRLSESLRRGDRAGALNLIMAGGGIFLPKGTQVMAKDWSFPGIEEVSVQTPGEHFGERLFLSWSCVAGGGQ